MSCMVDLGKGAPVSAAFGDKNMDRSISIVITCLIVLCGCARTPTSNSPAARNARSTGQHFNHVIENDPKNVAFWDKVNLARSYITTNQGRRAQDLIDELFVVSDGDKTKSEGARILAEDYLYIWKKHEANRLFRYFIENDPNNPDARNALAQVAYTYLAIKDYNAAEAAGKQFIGKYSDHNDTPKFVHTLASGFRKREQFEKALPLLDYVIFNYPDDPHCEKAWMEKATIGLGSANDVIVEQVINKFKKELQENPFIAEPFRLFADQFVLRYEAQQAQELYQYIIDHSQDIEQVLECRMGQAIILIDENDQTAFDTLVADFSSRPEGGKLLYAFAGKCELFKHLDYSEAAYRRILEVDPSCDAAAIFQYIGWTLFARSLYDQAITEYRKTVEEYPNSKWASSCQYWIGQSYYKKRDYEQARVEYQKVVDEYPDDRYATYSRTKIATIERRWKRTGPSKQ
ncbi:MAG: tetratricopeptide repeat protein [Planctomycetes bacterium]|nr:tetratricopeptide repeat protein [Planctomycetota bacterium]